MTCNTTTMTAGSTYTIQLNAVAPLTVERVTSMTFAIYKVGSATALVTKSLGDGIEVNDDGWLVTIPGEQISSSGYFNRVLKFTSNSLPYIIRYNKIEIKPNLPS